MKRFEKADVVATPALIPQVGSGKPKVGKTPKSPWSSLEGVSPLDQAEGEVQQSSNTDGKHAEYFREDDQDQEDTSVSRVASEQDSQQEGLSGNDEEQGKCIASPIDASQENPMKIPHEPQSQTNGEIGCCFVLEEVVKLDDISAGDEPLVRVVDREHVENIVAALEAGRDVPSLVVDNELQVVDGRHRYEALLKLRRAEVKVRVFKYSSESQRFVHAVSLNVSHGKPLSRKEKKKIGIRLFKENMAPGEIAGTLAVSTRTVQGWTSPVRTEERKTLCAQATSLRNEGLPMPLIGVKLGVSEKMVRGLLRPKRKSAERAETSVVVEHITVEPEGDACTIRTDQSHGPTGCTTEERHVGGNAPSQASTAAERSKPAPVKVEKARPLGDYLTTICHLVLDTAEAVVAGRTSFPPNESLKAQYTHLNNCFISLSDALFPAGDAKSADPE